MSDPGRPGGGLPIFVRGEDGQWQPLRESAEPRSVVADARGTARQVRVRPRVCRFAIASIVACVLGPFTLGVLSVASIVLGAISLRRYHERDDPVSGRNMAIGAIGGSIATLLAMLFMGPLGARVSADGCAGVFRPDFAGKVKASQETARIREAAAKWSEGGCPTLGQLGLKRLLAADQSAIDPWGTPYRIGCEADSIVVSSWGPDRRPDTADDIVAGR